MAVFLIRDPKCVFIHIPKTGGASIRHGFFEGNIEGPKQGFVPDAWQSHFKFAFVRNPYDRLVSAWKMFSGGMSHSKWEQPHKYLGIELRPFLDIVTDESVSYSGQRELPEEKVRHHTIPQTHPFNCLERADFVGRFESLETDFSRVCTKIGIPFHSLPHWNQTTRESNYLDYYDAESLGIVEQYFVEDFAALGYKNAHD